MKIKIDLTAIFAIFVVLFCNAGMMGFLKGSILITLCAYGSVLLWLILAFINDRKCFQQFILVSFPVILFWIFLEMYLIFAKGELAHTSSNIAKNILFFMVFTLMFTYYCVPKRKLGRRMILFCWLIDTIFSSIYTIYRLEENPMLSRILATGNKEEYLDTFVSTAGVLGYGNIYGLVLVMCALYWIIKNVKSVKKVIIIFCGILLMYTVVQAQFFIAVIITLFVIIVNVIWEEENVKKRRIAFVIMIPCLIIVGYIFIYFIPKIITSDILPSMISDRIWLFYNETLFDSLSSTRRGILYWQSITAIVNSFGMGIVFVGGTSAGGHSEILDLIAHYGFIFASVFIYGMLRIKKSIYHLIPMNSKRNYNIVWFAYIIISFLNTSLWCPTTLCLFLIIPIMYLEFNSTQDKRCPSENLIN